MTEAQNQSKSLPQVSLAELTIPANVLAIIPLPTAERFHVIAFEETDQVLKLALVYPEQLKPNFFLALEEIGKRIGRTVELYQTDLAGFKSALSAYRGSGAAEPSNNSGGSWPPAPQPPLFELGHLVAFNYLRRIPYPFALKERVLAVDFARPNTYWFLTDGSNDARLQRAVQFIAEHNKITIHMLVVAKKDFDELLEYYASLLSNEEMDGKQEEDEQSKRLRKEEEAEIERKLVEMNATNNPMLDTTPTKLAEGVIQPGISAEIVTTEAEKRGLAGFIQRVAQNFAAGKDEEGHQEPFTPAVAAGGLVPAASPAPLVVPPPPPEGVVPPPPAPNNAGTTPEVSPPPPAATPAPAASPASKPPRPGSDENIGSLIDRHVENDEELRNLIRGGNIPQIVAAIVSFAIHEKASDIHLESFEDEVRIRYRIDGQLTDIVKLPPDIHNPIVSRIKILARQRLDENRIPQDGRFDVNFDEKTQVDVRVSVMPTVHGEKVVLRLLDKSKGITSLERLGVEGMAYIHLTQSIQKPYGICLATGPTGSGKSTTLYAILSRIATGNVNVVTLEDPIEYEIKGVNQSQIRPKIGYTFAEGLRSILRQDPNIIMVGEIRDGETANMATQAALTGHLVLSTLHTNDASGAIPRLTNMGIEPFLITSSLNMVLAQRLVRRICNDCREEVSLPQGIKDKLIADVHEIAEVNPVDAKRIKEPITFYQGSGCAKCGGKGYRGRIGIYEVLVMDDGLGELTIERASSVRIAEQARRQGMLTLYQDGLLKAVNGITTIDEVLRETANK